MDVRIIAATNRNLKQDVEMGRFRQDLYYRLNVFPVEVAPLRKRKEDIPLLAAHFLEQAVRRLNVPAARLTPAQVIQLQNYDRPGNVRELQNTLERALILAQNGVLNFDFSKVESRATNISAPVTTVQSNGNRPCFAILMLQVPY